MANDEEEASKQVDSVEVSKVTVEHREGDDGAVLTTTTTSTYRESTYHDESNRMSSLPYRIKVRKGIWIGQESYDNPFRPDGQLSQDVDPIVKLYSHKSPKNIKEDQIRLSYHGQQLVDDEDGSKPHEDGLCPVSVHLQEKSAAKGAAKGANGPKDGAGGDGADSAEKKKKHKACCSMM